MKVSTLIRAARRAVEVADEAICVGSDEALGIYIRKLQQAERLFDYAIKAADRQDERVRTQSAVIRQATLGLKSLTREFSR